jgi:hypothetical protein
VSLDHRPRSRRPALPLPAGFAGGINVYAYAGEDPLNAVDPMGLSYSTVQAPNGDIFVQVPITIYGEAATPELARKWQEAILGTWHGHTWNGCRVLFQVYVQANPNHNWYFTAAGSDNMISVIDSPKAVLSHTASWGWGYWWSKDSRRVTAREFGHMLGLDDHYNKDTLKAELGWEGDIMAMDPYVTHRDLNQVLKGRGLCGCK